MENMKEMTLEDQVAWREKVHALDASLHAALDHSTRKQVPRADNGKAQITEVTSNGPPPTPAKRSSWSTRLHLHGHSSPG
jgi:ribosomal protein S10